MTGRGPGSPETPADARESQREVLREDLDFVTHQLSSRVRQLSFGSVALAWGFLAGITDATVTVRPVYLVWVCILGIVTLLLDAAQYVSGYVVTRATWKDFLDGGTGKFRTDSLAYRLRKGLFAWKLVGAAVTVAVLLFALATALAGT